MLAVFCSADNGAKGSGGFPPPDPPTGLPPDSGSDSDSHSPSGSVSLSGSETESPASGSSTPALSSTSSSGTCGPISTVADPGPTSVGALEDGSRRLRSRVLTPRDSQRSIPLDRARWAKQLKSHFTSVLEEQ